MILPLQMRSWGRTRSNLVPETEEDPSFYLQRGAVDPAPQGINQRLERSNAPRPGRGGRSIGTGAGAGFGRGWLGFWEGRRPDSRRRRNRGEGRDSSWVSLSPGRRLLGAAGEGRVGSLWCRVLWWLALPLRWGKEGEREGEGDDD